MTSQQPVPLDFPTDVWRDEQKQEAHKRYSRELMTLSGPLLRGAGFLIGLHVFVCWLHTSIFPARYITGPGMDAFVPVEYLSAAGILVLLGLALVHGLTLQARLSRQVSAIDRAEPVRRELRTFGPTGTCPLNPGDAPRSSRPGFDPKRTRELAPRQCAA